MPRIGKGLSVNKPTWDKGKTTVIRIPIALKDKLIALARAIDGTDADIVIVDREAYELGLKILEEALSLKANAGGAIKEQIREALGLMKLD